MPKPYPKELRDDVVAVARRREPGTTLKQIAADFGISESCLTNWLSRAERTDGRRCGPSSAEREESADSNPRPWQVTRVPSGRIWCPRSGTRRSPSWSATRS